MENKDAAKKRADAKLKRDLYARAAEYLRTAAEWADKRDDTWTRIYAEMAVRCALAARDI